MHSLAVIGIALLLNEERGAKEGHFTKDLSVFSFDAGSRGKRRRKWRKRLEPASERTGLLTHHAYFAGLSPRDSTIRKRKKIILCAKNGWGGTASVLKGHLIDVSFRIGQQHSCNQSCACSKPAPWQTWCGWRTAAASRSWCWCTVARSCFPGDVTVTRRPATATKAARFDVWRLSGTRDSCDAWLLTAIASRRTKTRGATGHCDEINGRRKACERSDRRRKCARKRWAMHEGFSRRGAKRNGSHTSSRNDVTHARRRRRSGDKCDQRRATIHVAAAALSWRRATRCVNTVRKTRAIEDADVVATLGGSVRRRGGVGRKDRERYVATTGKRKKTNTKVRLDGVCRRRLPVREWTSCGWRAVGAFRWCSWYRAVRNYSAEQEQQKHRVVKNNKRTKRLKS